MPIFKLEKFGHGTSNARLIEASQVNIQLEQHVESWLENSPGALIGEPILWIGRQTNAKVDDGTVFPDLLGLDREGNLIIVELKKGKAPRDVVAQILEYAAWSNNLSEEKIKDIALLYFRTAGLVDFEEAFLSTFDIEEVPSLNQNLRLFVVAETISTSVARVSRFLRTSHGMDISCLEVTALSTAQGEILIDLNYIVGKEDVIAPKNAITTRWTGDKSVKEIVWEAVQTLIQNDQYRVFAPKDVAKIIHNKYPDFKLSNVNPELTSDCINHTSRHHYPGGKDRYWRVGTGQYRLYDPSKDILP